MSTVDPQAPLTDAERAEILALRAHHETPRAACIEALKFIQSQHRWVSDPHLGELAALLNLPRAELEGVATFYNLIFRKPVGEHVIFLCDSVSCWIMGRDQINAHLQTRLGIQPGETTSDNAYTMLPIVCLGHCDHAPAMLLDDTLHGDLTPAGIDALLGLPPAPED